MYNKDDKRRLYWLIEQYILGQIDEPLFCDEYYYSYDLQISKDTLSDIERRVFSELSTVSSRFSQYKEDHKLDARAFTTLQELKQKNCEYRTNHFSL